MKMRACRINSRADYREDFDYPKLYELRKNGKEGFVQMLGVLLKDPMEENIAEDALVEWIMDAAGEFKGIQKKTLKDEIGRIAKGKAADLFKEYGWTKMQQVILEREKQLSAGMRESAAQEVWLFAAFHELARQKAQIEDWDYLMNSLAGDEWTTESAYDFADIKGQEKIVWPYCRDGEIGEMPLEMVSLKSDKILPKTVWLQGTSVCWKLFKGDTLFALRRGEQGYTGFLGCAKGEAAEAFKRTFGCVKFCANGTIDFGELDEQAKNLYHMPCPTADGATAFIGGDGRLYRMGESGRLTIIPNPDNVMIVQACSTAAGEYVWMDDRGCVRRMDEKGHVIDAAQTIKEGAFAMALHGGVCCVLMHREEGGVQTKLLGGSEAERSALQAWLEEMEKAHGQPCGLQTLQDGTNAPRIAVSFERKGEMICHE